MYLEIGLLALAVILFFYYYNVRHFGYWKKRGIQYERPIPFFGNLWESTIFKKAAGEVSSEVYRKYPGEKVVGMFHYDTPVLLVRDPKLVNKIFVSDFNYFSCNSGNVDESTDPVLSRNMFFQRDKKWKQTRQMLSPAFTVARIKPVFEMMSYTCKKLRDYVVEHPEECELKYLMSRLTSEIVASCALGVDGRCFDEQKPEMVKVGELIFEPGLINGFVQAANFFMPNVTRIFKLRFAPKEVSEFFNGILKNVIQHRQNNSQSTRQDLVQHWIDLKKKSQEVLNGNLKSDIIDREIDDEDILAGCVTFFIESYETTSMVLSFILHYLAVDRDIQERVRQEIEQVYASTNGKLTLEAVNEMPLVNNVILEVLRLHPAVLHAMKMCTKTYSMDIGRSEPLVVEKDTIVVIPNSALARDPLYWEDPEIFNPDRFNGMEKDAWKRDGVFLPFGDGPRICIGMRMAYAIMKLSLIHLLREFEVVPSPRTVKKIVQDPRHFMSRNRGGLYAKFVRRG